MAGEGLSRQEVDQIFDIEFAGSPEERRQLLEDYYGSDEFNTLLEKARELAATGDPQDLIDLAASAVGS